MNIEEIIELARLCDLGRVCGPLDTLFDDEWDMLHRFANAVIKAHEAKLIEGVGEPVAYKTDDVELYVREEKFGFYDIPLYTATQVAAAVLNAESEGVKRGMEFEYTRLLERITTLESTLKVALEALEAIVPCIEVHGDQYKPGNMWHTLSDKGTDAIKQIKEVLNG